MGDQWRGLAASADPTRARILRLIRESDDGRRLVGDLARTLVLRQPTVSHHMRALRDAGLVVGERDGRRVWYSIAPDEIARVDALLGPVAPTAPPDLERIVADLRVRCGDAFAADEVRAQVWDSYERLAGITLPALLASRTASFAAARLDAQRRISGDRPRSPAVLFVCVQNAGRSQIAAAILRQLAGDRIIVQTAGSAPGPSVRTAIVNVLDEIGIPLGGEFPKPLTDEMVRAADVVVTMGCGDACPIHPGRRYLDWDLDDPVGRPVDEMRAIRDDIDRRVRLLLQELGPEASLLSPSPANP